MQKSKTKDKQPTESGKSGSKSPDTYSNLDNRSVKKRYVDLWRARMRNDEFKDSLVPPSVAGLLSFVIGFGLAPSLLSASIMLLLGSISGLMYSGYKYQTDNFTAFHVSLLSYLPLAFTLLVATSIASPVLLPLTIPLVIFYAVAVGSSGVTYTMLGRQASDQ